MLLHLDVLPGSIIAEAGTGSGSLTASLARAVAPNGHVHTFDFHADRAAQAQSEFKELDVSHLVTAGRRDVAEEGFPAELDGKVDGLVLDIPSPWLAVGGAKKALKPGGRICTFSI